MSRRIKVDNIDQEEQLLVRLAFACEIEGLTQAQAAERFGLTRLRVNKGLSEARARGILRVSIDSIYTSAAEQEWELEDRFGLDRAIVVPRALSPESVTRLVAAGLGGHLNALLQTETVKRFGMSWGNTLNLATRFMQPIDRPELEIVSVMGGVSKGADVNGYEITTRLADLCNAKHSYFTAPLYAGSPESRDVLMQQDVISEMLLKIRGCDAVAIATSDLVASLLVRDALPREFSAADLIVRGGVGDILGHVLNEAGEMIDHELNRRVVGLSLKDLPNIPNVILAAGGAHKTPIMQAALKRGFVNTLVTDQDTASTLLARIAASN